MPEFDLIARIEDAIRTATSGQSSPCVIGIGDDGAVLEVPADQQLVVTTDTLVAGVHFLPGTSAVAVGHKSLAVNLSDLAAMGAEPAWFFLALTLPSEERGWLDSFMQGIAKLAGRSGMTLAGGDVTMGPLSITITALGLLDTGRALTRSGGRPGDLVVLSGATGAAACALAALNAGKRPEPASRLALEFPEPRNRLGTLLPGLASSCIDVSDGLLADLGHILHASGCGAEIELERLPSADCLSGLPDRDRWRLQLTGGDDYELCFTVAAEAAKLLPELAETTGVPLTVIGRLTGGNALLCLQRNGEPFLPDKAGFEHFS